MVRTWTPKVQVSEETLMINNHGVVHWVNIFSPIEPNLVGPIIPRLWILMNVPLMSPMQPYNSTKFVPNTTCSSHNPSLGLVTKARACKGIGQKGSPGITSHAPGSVGECEGMNTHTPKWAPILGIGVSTDSRIFREELKGSKPIELKSFLYHWKALKT
jgi:hypothetical protein